ncbi:hypothetical protein FKZ61_008515 [Litorilinea aerophila]|uniref:Cobalamin biosynthesis protein n=1 Tax=Litorilinea aerophila TaxID=1204385 RepID=A0A540VH61_9CHLR|nr:GTP-binding protein [Litorilinea aerophila]MCC9076152.1 hypothetical protein [Litorilinea aerophila]GIV78851.1 MAG: cobalamin synthesis protein P47K [Litorilinea sp.]
MKTKVVLVGGFLGAGKTTLLLAAAHRLAAQGKRVGLVTNDQGADLVDTALAAQQQLPVAEVSGGCFCCRFPDLLQSLQHLQRTVRPDVILAEPVGSCTDLVATVLLPLQHHHADAFELAPLTVLLDAGRQLDGFPATVDYLYRQQLAEAELIGLNKVDQLSLEQQEDLAQELTARYPDAQIMPLAARAGTGLDGWLTAVLTRAGRPPRVLDIDYGRYGEAEAALGWLNARGTLRGRQPFSPQNWLRHFFHLLEATLTAQGAAIAHLKAQIQAPGIVCKASLTQAGAPLSWDVATEGTTQEQAQFVINARVGSHPDVLAQAVRHAMAEICPPTDFQYRFAHFECFSPQPPRPTHRMAALP